MSSTNKTSLGLNMWEASDKPVRQDFVNDNVIIDEKITKLNTDIASKAGLGSNTYTDTQIVSFGNMGTSNSVGINIVARTDINQYSRPSLAFDCHGTISGVMYLEVDGTLKMNIGDGVYRINMTREN